MTTQILAGASDPPNTHADDAPATQTSIDSQSLHVAHRELAVDGTPLPVSQHRYDAHPSFADGDQLAGATDVADAQTSLAPATQTSIDGHMASDTHTNCAVDGTQLAETKADPFIQAPFVSATQLGGQARSGAHTSSAADSTSTGGHLLDDAQIHHAPGGFLRDPVLGVLADVVDDLEKVRIANANRVRQLTRTGEDSDGEERGFGLTEDHPEVAKLALTVKALQAAEHDATLNLQRALRKHPLAPFQKRHKGIGEKQLARLLAVIGDPYWNDLHRRPRTVSELWAYAGFHVIRTSGGHPSRDAHQVTAAGTSPHAGSQPHCDPHRQAAPGVAPKRQRGQRSNWSEDARKRVWVIASAMPKFPGGKYEALYRTAREKYADAIHPTDCVRCGPAGKPALAGSPLSLGHQNARAHRLVAKEILKDLWIEARDLYAGESEATSVLVSMPGAEAAPGGASRDVDPAPPGASNVP